MSLMLVLSLFVLGVVIMLGNSSIGGGGGGGLV